MDACGMTITPREEVNPEEGIREYGDVLFADPVNNTYPLDTPEHIKAAWSLSHLHSSEDKYSRQDFECIERRIQEAAAAQGITLGS
jgi:hypothetical protein